MRFVDSGVVVAAFASWHEAHDAARREISGGPGIAAHALTETYSVLTRLPAPHRARADIVATYLDRVFDRAPISLPPAAQRALVVDELPASGISGGATYDALIAATIRHAGGILVTLDQRALTTYRRIGCPAELLG